MRQKPDSKQPPHHAFTMADLTDKVPESCCLPDLPAASIRKCLNGSEYFLHKSVSFLPENLIFIAQRTDDWHLESFG